MTLRFVTSGLPVFASCLLLAGLAYAQQKDAAPDSGAVIRTETKLVLVDAVITDRKGEYVHNLTQKDFKVWEDNKEQTIKSFSVQSDPANPAVAQKRYIVLFFDNSTMGPADQGQARKAAAKFIDSNSGPNRLMSVINFGGTIQIAQNFTGDVNRLKQSVNGIKTAVTGTNTGVDEADTALAKASMDFGARDMLLALRSLAKDLSAAPGRKTLILFTEGFPLDSEKLSELTATVDACNKSNVAVYPIDARGLIAPTAELYTPTPGRDAGAKGVFARAFGAILQPVAFTSGTLTSPGMAFFQRGGGGGGAGGGGSGGGGGGRGGSGGGGAPGGGAPGGGGGRGGSPGPAPGAGNGMTGRGNMPPNMNTLGPPTQARNALLKIPDSGVDNQNMMKMLADGTGGFVIMNTNDLFGGLDKIGKEMDEYYILGYTPPESEVGSCHTLRVKVDQNGTTVRARSGYCNGKSQDFLAGSSVEKTLESRAVGNQPGNIAASMQLPFFYTGTNEARVNVAMEIPSNALKFEKQKGKYLAEMNVLGIAYKPDGSVGARFSDTLKREFDDKKEVEAFEQTPSFHYENEFEVASGEYNLKVVFSAAGNNFGKIETPLKIEPWSDDFGLSALALSKEYRPQAAMAATLDATLIEDRVPLITKGVQVIPYGSDKFARTPPPLFYTEIYEPLLTNALPENRPVIGLQIRILDRKTKEQKYSTGMMRIDMTGVTNNPTIPLAERIPLDKVEPGQYTVEVKAGDSAGRQATRTVDLDLM